MNAQITSIVCGLTSVAVVGMTLTVSFIYARAHKFRRLRHVVIIALGVAITFAMVAIRMNQNYARLSHGLELTATPNWILHGIIVGAVLVQFGLFILLNEVLRRR